MFSAALASWLPQLSAESFTPATVAISARRSDNGMVETFSTPLTPHSQHAGKLFRDSHARILKLRGYFFFLRFLDAPELRRRLALKALQFRSHDEEEFRGEVAVAPPIGHALAAFPGEGLKPLPADRVDDGGGVSENPNLAVGHEREKIQLRCKVSSLHSAAWKAGPGFETIPPAMAPRFQRPDIPKAIGERLALIRIAYGKVQGFPGEMSQSEMARRCEIGIAAWNNAETGDNRMGLDNAIKLSRKTGVSLDYIYFGQSAGLPHAIAVEIEKLLASSRSGRRA